MARLPHAARLALSAGVLFLGTSTPLAAQRVSASSARMNRFVDSVLARLTLEEKLGQLTQYRGRFSLTGPQTPEAGAEDIRAGRVGSFLGVRGAAPTREMQQIAVTQSRTRIPLLFADDIIHGWRTIFPVPLAEAASFNPALAERTARIAAVEGAAAGIHWTFAPMVDITREPRWGRVVEGAGEDPYLGSAIAAAKVRGFQGASLRDSLSLMATAKHFVAYGAAEGGRDYNTTDVPLRTLHEMYLPPFHAAVNAGVKSIMAAFNQIDGVPMHANKALIDGVLRTRWGWDGILVSDYTGVMELLQHGLSADSGTVGRLSIDAGVDVDMVSNIFYKDLPREVRAGRLPVAVVDSAVRRVLRTKYELGLFDNPFKSSSEAREKALTLTSAHRAEARAAAQQSIVLLRNEGNVLPLAKSVKTVAVIGALADDARSALGGWAAAGRPEDAVTVLVGIRKAVGADTRVLYAPGAPVEAADTTGFAEAVRIAREADVVVMVVGEHQDMSAEARNRSSLDVPGVQQQLVERVHAVGKPTVAVLMNGRPLSIPWMVQHVPAIVESWYLGVEHGNAVADVLFGAVNPSGRLPITFPRTVGQVPIYYNHMNTGRPSDEKERYTSKYFDIPFTPLYAFGHGLSYTTFRYSAPTLSRSKGTTADSVTVSVTVTNTGARSGDEVVQLYVRDDAGSVSRPVKELKGFRRISLAAGASETVTFRLTPDELSFYGAQYRRVIEPGTFTIMVGPSSDRVQSTTLELTGRTRVLDARSIR